MSLFSRRRSFSRFSYRRRFRKYGAAYGWRRNSAQGSAFKKLMDSFTLDW